MAAEGTLYPDWPDRVIEVMNKADLLGGTGSVAPRDGAVAISAITGEGLDELRAAIDRQLVGSMVPVEYNLAVDDGAAMAWLYAHGEVTSRRDTEDAMTLSVRLLPADHARFERQHAHGSGHDGRRPDPVVSSHTPT